MDIPVTHESATPTRQEIIREAVKDAGGLTAVAKNPNIDVSKSAVADWINRGVIPPPHCPEIEKMTGRKHRCEVLNPDVDWGYIRSSSPAA